MTKVYIVTGIANYGESRIQETLYAGVDKSRANKINIDLPYIELILEVWINDVLIKSYSKTNIYEWTDTFDKLGELEDELYNLTTKVNAVNDEVITLRALVRGVE